MLLSLNPYLSFSACGGFVLFNYQQSRKAAVKDQCSSYTLTLTCVPYTQKLEEDNILQFGLLINPLLSDLYGIKKGGSQWSEDP